MATKTPHNQTVEKREMPTLSKKWGQLWKYGIIANRG
jgi:hypothetical protein